MLFRPFRNRSSSLSSLCSTPARLLSRSTLTFGHSRRVRSSAIAAASDREPVPYATCSGFSNCQRLMCDQNARPGAFWAGVFFESVSNATCTAIGDRALSEALLPRLGSYVAFQYLTKHAVALELFAVLFYTVLRIIDLSSAYVWVLFAASVAMQVGGGALWITYMRELGFMYGEQLPTWFIHSALLTSVTTLVATLLAHIYLVATMHTYTNHTAFGRDQMHTASTAETDNGSKASTARPERRSRPSRSPQH